MAKKKKDKITDPLNWREKVKHEDKNQKLIKKAIKTQNKREKGKTWRVEIRGNKECLVLSK